MKKHEKMTIFPIFPIFMKKRKNQPPWLFDPPRPPRRLGPSSCGPLFCPLETREKLRVPLSSEGNEALKKRPF
jgi:hypothetical protein